MKERKMCLIASSAPTYRKEIFNRMGKDLGCDFLLGAGPTKQMDIHSLPGHIYTTRTIHIGNSKLCWQPGMLSNTKDYGCLIVNLEFVSISGWFLLILAKIRRQKTFYWGHGWYGREGFLKRIIKKLYYSLCTGLLLYGDRAKELMIEAGYKKEKLHVIHNSLAYSEQLPLREAMRPSSIFEEHFGNKDRNIIFIGRLRKVKRFDLLIDAVAQLKKRNQNVNVTFIGDGEERQELEQRVRKLGLEHNVWFYGTCFDEETNAVLIYNADLCVSPGNIGLTAIHVMMFGCPAITNDNFEKQMPEFETIHEGTTGAFFKAEDASSLADVISLWFLKHGGDRERIRENCFKEIDDKWNPNYQIGVLKNAITYK